MNPGTCSRCVWRVSQTCSKSRSDPLCTLNRFIAISMRGPREKITPDLLAGITVPVLVAVGTEDVIGGSGAELAALIPGAKLLDIKGRDHMKAVGDASFKRGVLDFLTQRV